MNEEEKVWKTDVDWSPAMARWVQCVTGPVFWQPYLCPSNLWASYCRFTHTHATP